MSSSSKFIDEPPTWRKVIFDSLRNMSTALWIACFLFFSVFSVVAMSILVHVHVFDVGWIASWEVRSGTTFGEDTSMVSLYINTGLYLLASGASLYRLLAIR